MNPDISGKRTHRKEESGRKTGYKERMYPEDSIQKTEKAHD
jgi:hypothetical protein